MQEQIDIAVIGGTGLYAMPGISDRSSLRISTPWGDPSGDIVVGTLHGKRVAFLPRHGTGHRLGPSLVPYRANIYALKSLGVRFIISVNACGSLREDYQPGHIVVPDQLYDNTRGLRPATFFERDLVSHISVAQPFCDTLRGILGQSVASSGGTVHEEGTFLIIEGPRFSTRGESRIFRQWGCSIIGMTTCPEAFLAREAEIAYASLAHVTDYDVWKDEPVTVEKVFAVMQENLRVVQGSVAEAVGHINSHTPSDAHTALDNAILVERDQVPPDLLTRLGPIVARRFA